MAKRKHDRKAARLKAIKARLLDLWMGVHGYYSFDDPNHEEFVGYASAGSETFSRFVGAVRRAFDPGWGETEALIRCDEIEHFDTPDTLAAWIVEEQDRKAVRDGEGK